MKPEQTRCVSMMLSLISGIFLLAFVSCNSGGNGSQPPSTEHPPAVSVNKGYALAIGLNRVDPAHYGGWSGELSGCEPDARDMEEIEKSQGFDAIHLLTTEATRSVVLAKLSDLAEKMNSGDILVLSYSGHGGQVPDQNGDETEDDLDETWCLFDGELIDDELFQAWMKFRDGVRILVFSDSCHSGTVTRMKKVDFAGAASSRIRDLEREWNKFRVPSKLDREAVLQLPELRDAIRIRPDLRRSLGSRITTRNTSAGVSAAAPVRIEEETVFISRALPPQVAINTFQTNKNFYVKIGNEAPREDPSKVKAAVISISGCEDAQTSADLGFNGLFTWALKKVWDQGAFSGDHHRFHEAIKAAVLNRNPTQSPQYLATGNGPDVFSGQRPFTIKK